MTDGIGLPDGEYTAVVDNVEDGLATVFFEADGEDVGDAILDATVLPEEARHADAILSVTVRDGALVHADYRPERTESRREAAQDRFDRLSRRPPSDDDS